MNTQIVDFRGFAHSRNAFRSGLRQKVASRCSFIERMGRTIRLSSRAHGDGPERRRAGNRACGWQQQAVLLNQIYSNTDIGRYCLQHDRRRPVLLQRQLRERKDASFATRRAAMSCCFATRLRHSGDWLSGPPREARYIMVARDKSWEKLERHPQNSYRPEMATTQNSTANGWNGTHRAATDPRQTARGA